MAQDAIINRWNVNGDIYEIQDAGRGHPLGVATLDENGQVPLGQLPENIDVTDAVTDGDMHPVTSNAVYDALKNKEDVPLGSIMPYYGTSDPTDGKWFICDGRDTTGTAIELETHYPSLYIFLGGTNVLPDLREVALVGVGQNTTDSIANHDIYTLGQFKDDQIQEHTHGYRLPDATPGGTGQSNTRAWYGNTGQTEATGTTGRYGTTTHGKQKGVNYIIKATSSTDTAPIPGTDIQTIESYVDTGLTTVTNAFNTKIAQAQSYSTEETFTGGYWIDGKPIYRKVIEFNSETTIAEGGTNFTLATLGLSDIDNVFNIYAFNTTGSKTTKRRFSNIPFYWYSDTTLQLRAPTSTTSFYLGLVIEYTKTTD